MGKNSIPIENAGFRQTCLSCAGQRQRRDVTFVLRPVQADFRELPAHPATTSEFKQFEFFDLTGFSMLDGVPGHSSFDQEMIRRWQVNVNQECY